MTEFSALKYVYYNPEAAFTTASDARAFYLSNSNSVPFLDDGILAASNVDALAYMSLNGLMRYDVTSLNRAIGSAMRSNGIRQSDLDAVDFYLPNVLATCRLVESNILELFDFKDKDAYLLPFSNLQRFTPSNVSSGDKLRIVVDDNASIIKSALASFTSNTLVFESSLVTNFPTTSNTVYTVYGIRAYDPDRLGDILFLREFNEVPDFWDATKAPTVSFEAFNTTLYGSLYPESLFSSARQAYLESLAYGRLLEADDIAVRTSQTVLLYNNLVVQKDAGFCNDVTVWGNAGIGTDAFPERLTVYSGNLGIVAAAPGSNGEELGYLSFGALEGASNWQASRWVGVAGFPGDSNSNKGGAILYVNPGSNDAADALAIAVGHDRRAYFAGALGVVTSNPQERIHVLSDPTSFQSSTVFLQDLFASNEDPPTAYLKLRADAYTGPDLSWAAGLYAADSNFRIGALSESNVALSLKPDGRVSVGAPAAGEPDDDPSTGALRVYGSARFEGDVDAGQQVLADPGDSASAPGHSWKGHSDTGMFLGESNAVGIAVASTQRMLLRQDGIVDIFSDVHLAGDLIFAGSNRMLQADTVEARNQFWGSSNDAAQVPSYSWPGAYASTGMFLADEDQTRCNLAFSTAGVERMRIQDGEGYVGIGTTAATHRLHLYSSNPSDYRTAGILLQNAASGGVGIALQSAPTQGSNWTIGMDGLDLRLRIGYGSGAPLMVLDAEHLQVTESILATSSGSNAPGYSFAERPDVGMYLLPGTSNLSFSTAGRERLRIQGDTGRVTVHEDLYVAKNLFVMGQTTEVQTETLLIKDNLLVINSTLTSNDPPLPPNFVSGLEINRGYPDSNYFLVFAEEGEVFKIGLSNQLQTVATREDAVADKAILFFDASNARLTFRSNVVIDEGSRMGVGTSSADTHRLHVEGDGTSYADAGILVRATDPSGEAGIAFQAPRLPGARAWVIGMGGSGGSCNLKIGMGLSNAFPQQTLLELTSTGKLGIGTVPQETLHTNGNMVTTGFASFSSNVSIASTLFCSNDIVFQAFDNTFAVSYTSNLLDMGGKISIDVGSSVVSVLDDLYVPKSITTTNIHYLSDRRMKKNIRETESAADLETLEALPIVTFEYVDGDAFGSDVHKGVVAQDLPTDLTTETTDVIPCIMADATWFPEYKTLLFSARLEEGLEVGDILAVRRKQDRGTVLRLRVASKGVEASQGGDGLKTLLCVTQDSSGRAVEGPAEEVFVVGKMGPCRTVKYDALLMTSVNAIKALTARVRQLEAMLNARASSEFWQSFSSRARDSVPRGPFCAST